MPDDNIIWGLCGVFIGAGLSFFCQYILTVKKLRAEVALNVILWGDNIVHRAGELDQALAHPDNPLNDPMEIVRLVKTFPSEVMSNEIPAKIALTYGFGKEYGLFFNLREEALSVFDAIVSNLRSEQ